MDKIRIGKIQVGSLMKAINRAKKLGQFCPKELYIFNVIADLHTTCGINQDYDTQIYLETLLNTLINNNPSICAYRERKEDTINIKGAPKNTFNMTGIVPEKTIISTDTFLATTDNKDLIFTVEDFTNNVVLQDNLTYGVKITSLPNNGQLTLNGVAVILNNIIPFSDINLNLFKFVPVDINVNYIVNFSFQIHII